VACFGSRASGYFELQGLSGNELNESSYSVKKIELIKNRQYSIGFEEGNIGGAIPPPTSGSLGYRLRKGYPRVRMMKNSIASAMIGALLSTIVWLFARSPISLVPGLISFIVFYAYLGMLDKNKKKLADENWINPEWMIGMLKSQTETLKSIILKVEEDSIKSELVSIKESLDKTLEFLNSGLGKPESFRRFIRDYLPSLISVAEHYLEASKYNFANNGKYIEFFNVFNKELNRTLKDLFEDESMSVEIDMLVTMELLRENEFQQTLNR